MILVESSIEVLHSILHPSEHSKIEYSTYDFSSQSIEVALIQIIMVRHKLEAQVLSEINEVDH